MKYPALFEAAPEGRFVITFPDIEGAISQGDNERDAQEMAQDALITMIAHLIRHGKTVPSPSLRKGRLQKGQKYRMIELPAIAALKTELYIAFRNSGLTKTALAQKLGIPKTTIDRLFAFRNHTRLDQIEAAFAALGKRVAVQIEDAA
jgi:antitoxin HicB